MQDKKKNITFEDFEKGLMLAGYISPDSDKEIKREACHNIKYKDG